MPSSPYQIDTSSYIGHSMTSIAVTVPSASSPERMAKRISDAPIGLRYFAVLLDMSTSKVGSAVQCSKMLQ